MDSSCDASVTRSVAIPEPGNSTVSVKSLVATERTVARSEALDQFPARARVETRDCVASAKTRYPGASGLDGDDAFEAHEFGSLAVKITPDVWPVTRQVADVSRAACADAATSSARANFMGT